MNVTNSRVGIALLACGWAAMPGLAAQPQTSVEAQINEVMQTFMAAWARQAKPEELSHLLYDTSGEFALVGEGLKQPVERVPVLLKEFETLRSEWRAGCTFTLKGPVKQSGSLAATLNTLGCPATPSAAPFDYYVLLVWNHTSRGWRVVMESYSTYKPGK